MQRHISWIIPVIVFLAIALPAFVFLPTKSQEVHFVGMQQDANAAPQSEKTAP